MLLLNMATTQGPTEGLDPVACGFKEQILEHEMALLAGFVEREPDDPISEAVRSGPREHELKVYQWSLIAAVNALSHAARLEEHKNREIESLRAEIGMLKDERAELLKRHLPEAMPSTGGSTCL